MTTKPRIAVIIGSTRKTRFADKPAQWILDKAQARRDWDVELVDIRDFDLPLFDEMASNANSAACRNGRSTSSFGRR